jgi:catechol 2,3-dioxygenase-like lactoylglutathione lyase family enzyme
VTAIATTGVHHVRLTVTDLARSRAFYSEVLGFELTVESPGSPADPADAFESARVGLDPLGFAVATRPNSTRPETCWRSAAPHTASRGSWPTSGSSSCPSATRTACTWN